MGSKKVILGIQIAVALIFLSASIGGVVVGSIGASKLSSLKLEEDESFGAKSIEVSDVIESAEEYEATLNEYKTKVDEYGEMIDVYGGFIQQIVPAIGYTILLAFSGLFVLFSLFMLLDGLYKWPSRKR